MGLKFFKVIYSCNKYLTLDFCQGESSLPKLGKEFCRCPEISFIKRPWKSLNHSSTISGTLTIATGKNVGEKKEFTQNYNV